MEELLKQFMANINDRFDQLEKDTGQMRKHLEQGTKQVDSCFDQLEKGTGQMRKHLDQGMKQVDSRFDQLEKDTNQMKKHVDQGMKQMDSRFDQLEQNMTQLIEQNQTENRSYFKRMESQLDRQHQTFQVVSGELKGIKFDIDYLSEKTGKHDAEIHKLNRRF